MWGVLWELPTDVGEALGDPRLSECILFHLQRYFDHFYGHMSFERWGHTYRIVKEDKKKLKKKALPSHSSASSSESCFDLPQIDLPQMIINPRMVLFVNGARYCTEQYYEEDTAFHDDAADTTLIEEVVNITLPASHLVILDMHMPPEVIQHLNLHNIATLALPAKFLSAFGNRLFLAASEASRLRMHLLIFRIDKEDRKKFVDALVHLCISLHLEGVVLGSSFHHDSAGPALWSKVVGQLLSQRSQLAYLGMQVEASGELPPINSLLSQLKQFRLIGTPGQAVKSGLAASIQHRDCTLTRLDLCKCEDVSDEDIETLLGAITHDTTSLLDLGLRICNSDTMKLLVTSPALAMLLILRPFIDAESEEEETTVLNQLAQGLSRSDCKVRFLDLQLQWKLDTSFWHVLLESSSSRKTNPLEALRIYPQVCVKVQGGLADWLRSPSCSLVWLDCSTFMSTGSTFADVKEEWELANSLTNNFSVCTLAVCWKSPSAKALASSLIRRNQLYKSGQLLEEEQVQPNAAKLFLCGHGAVGKTTLCQTLLAKRSVRTSPSVATCGLLGRPERTRGMEFHSLSFEKGRRLVICDLAGQVEFHAFHHYFMNASNNDLFIVVCKISKESSQGVFERQLDYWLRFIVSHRCATDNVPESSTSSVTWKPKVIVVVNFFYSAAVAHMRAIAREKTDHLMTKFSRDLDFGPRVQEASGKYIYTNLFAIVALKVGHVSSLKKRLRSLLEELLESGRHIPKLCNDISALVLPPLTKNVLSFGAGCLKRSAKPPLFLHFSDVLGRYGSKFPDSMAPDISAQRVQAALMELHNQGLLVFFPKQKNKKAIIDGSHAVQEHVKNLVITDSGWFCNKLIGNLLGANLQRGSGMGGCCNCAWHIQDIRDMLRKQGCEHEYLEEIVRYLQELDLCLTTESDNTHEKDKCSMLLFPALMQERTIQYPQPFPAIESDGNSASHMRVAFFGRRLRCEDSSMHLIPSGVFTRLQVKLQRLSDNASYWLGNGWASLMKGKVGAVVRFGGDSDEFFENKQWIDILVCFPDSHSSSEASHKSSMLAGDRLMTQIKSLIYEICQAADFRGIPTVMLQEWVLQSKAPSSPAIPLSTIMEKVKEEGLESYDVAWPRIDITATPVVELLLPTELQEHVNSQLTALATVRREFSLSFEGGENMIISDESSSMFDKGMDKLKPKFENTGAGVLTGEQLWALIKERFDNIDQGMDSLHSTLQMIRKDIQSLGECLRQAERSIIANCSTRLLRHELTKDRAHPLYPYLVDTEGKLRALQSLFFKRSHLHFMCESPTDGPHPVQDQKGKEVTIKVEKWLTQTARVVVPAFRVICCMARLAATVCLPCSHVFIPSPACLSALGLDGNALQSNILPQALEALLKDVPDIDPHCIYSQEGSMIQQNEVKEAIKGILQEESIDMATDFSLRRVVFGNEEVYWVCDKHIGAGRELQPISNPFK